MKIIYECGVCGKQYVTEGAVMECENIPIPTPKYEIGDDVHVPIHIPDYIEGEYIITEQYEFGIIRDVFIKGHTFHYSVDILDNRRGLHNIYIDSEVYSLGDTVPYYIDGKTIEIVLTKEIVKYNS